MPVVQPLSRRGGSARLLRAMIGTSHSGSGAWQCLRVGAVLLAIIAVVLNGFAPGFHRIAMAQGPADEAMALCTSDRSAAADRHDGAPSHRAADDCCGPCIPGGAAFVAPSATAAAPPGVVQRAVPPAVARAALRRAPTGPPLPARGPPLFS
jgi:hypothetical protein